MLPGMVTSLSRAWHQPSAGLLVSGMRPNLLSWRLQVATEAMRNGLMEDPSNCLCGIDQR